MNKILGEKFYKTVIIISIIMSTTANISIKAETTIYDATDSTIFNKNVLLKNSTIDQSEKLQAIINKTVIDGKKLYIPSGTYIIEQNIKLTSNTFIFGDEFGATVFKNTTKNEVSFRVNEGEKTAANNIEFKHLNFDRIGIYTWYTNNVSILENVFYNPILKFTILSNSGDNHIHQGNIFLRDSTHAIEKDNDRMIYVAGNVSKTQYYHLTNYVAKDNIFGLKFSEIDALKAIATGNLPTRLEVLKQNYNNNLISPGGDEQNYFTSGINSFFNLKYATILNNIFYGMLDNQNTYGVTSDHMIYLRGSQDVYIVGNYARGYHNGPAGGFKIKSGKRIVFMNNYLRNTGIILYSTAEYGFSSTYQEEKISTLDNIMIANNIFDWKKWDNAYTIGIEYNDEGRTNVGNNSVFINNTYRNYQNIYSGARKHMHLYRKLINQNDNTIQSIGFGPEKNNYINGNTRDDNVNNSLISEHWAQIDIDNQPLSFEQVYKPNLYDFYLNTPIPMLNSLAVPNNNYSIKYGQTIDPKQLVLNSQDKDDGEVKYEIINPEVLSSNGTKIVNVAITYYENTIYPKRIVNIPVKVNVYDAPFKIILKDNNIDLKEISLLENESINLDTIEQPTKLGYKFIKWTLDKEGKINALTIMPNHDITLYAQWIKINFDDKYIENDDSINNSKTFINNNSFSNATKLPNSKTLNNTSEEFISKTQDAKEKNVFNPINYLSSDSKSFFPFASIIAILILGSAFLFTIQKK